jgi:uncharacterized protein HemX
LDRDEVPREGPDPALRDCRWHWPPISGGISTTNPSRPVHPSTAYKLQKAFRRNKVVFSAGTAVLLALLTGLGISLWLYTGKSAAEREQTQLRKQAEAKALEASEARAVAAQETRSFAGTSL